MALRDLADAPPVRPPRYSLLTAVETVDDAGLRWQGGYTYTAENTGPANHGAAGVDLTDCYSWAEEPDFDAGNREVETDPVYLWAGDACSTLTSRWRNEAEARVRRLLNATQSFNLAAWLWENTLGGAGSTIVTAAATDAAEALACLEQELAVLLAGPAGFVHVSPGVMTLLVASQAVRLDGARYVSPMGSVIVADAGYAAGAGPAAGAWMIGTGEVRARLGPIETQPAETGDWATVTVRERNLVRVLAGRAAAVEVDTGLAWVAAQVDLTCA